MFAPIVLTLDIQTNKANNPCARSILGLLKCVFFLLMVLYVVSEKEEKKECTPEPCIPAECASSPVSIDKELSASTVRTDNRKSSNPRRKYPFS